MLYEIHMLKNYPPVNLNRDETGSPKSCWFGGSQRGRISSQCLKRTWRTSPLFDELLGEKGIRTRMISSLIEEELRGMGASEELIAKAAAKATGIANKDGKESDKGITGQVIFYSKPEIHAIAAKMKGLYEADAKAFDKLSGNKLVDEFKKLDLKPVSVDIALFGRMVTSNAFKDVEASVQVAHAISTHAVNQESDYFTAVDDLVSGSEDSGAGMIGDIDYNASCYYHYVSIDTDQLSENLAYAEDRDALIGKIVPALVQILAFSNPGGKQNTFAGHSLPCLICVERKSARIPISYANAFAEPVNVRREPVISGSVSALKREMEKTDKAFGVENSRFWFCPDGLPAPEGACVCDTLQELCGKIMA